MYLNGNYEIYECDMTEENKRLIATGDVDYDLISKVKQSVKIPVIANGGVFAKEDADKLSTKTQQINSFRKFYALAEAVFVCVST